MVLKQRKCPNCGSSEILEKDGTFVCMQCRTFFDNPNEITITNVIRDEAKLEKLKIEERERQKGDKVVLILCIGLILFLTIGGIVLIIMNGR